VTPAGDPSQRKGSGVDCFGGLLRKCQPRGPLAEGQEPDPQAPCGPDGSIAPALRVPPAPPGAKAPGGCPTRPWGRFPPAGSGAGLLLVPDLPVNGAPSRAGGESRCVSCSRPEGRKQFHRFHGRGHRPCHSAPLPLVQPGAKAPGQRPTRPWRALLARRVGRWPALFLDRPIYRAPSRAGRGNAGRVSCSRPHRRKHCHRSNGRGHRPCHSAALASGPAGGQSPRPAPDPPMAGAGLSWCLDRPIYRAPCRAGGRNALRFLVPPGGAKALSPLLWQGPSPLPRRCAGIRTGRGPKPPASARPAPGGRFAPAGSGAGLLLFPDLPVCGAPSRRGGGNAVRFLVPPTLTKALSPLPWQGPSPLPQRHADPCPAGDQSPRPAPDPPTAGAGLSWRLDRPIYRAPCRAGGGNAARVSCSRPH